MRFLLVLQIFVQHLLLGSKEISPQLQIVIYQLRKLWKFISPERHLCLHFFEHCLGPDLFGHPLLEERLGRLPQIQLRIELTSQAFDIEQGLFQQDQLRLYHYMEAARGAKQFQ